MNNDPRNPDIPEQEQDSTIFSHHKSGEEIRQEEKEEKRRERREMTKALTADFSETRTVTKVMVIVLVIIVVGCVAAVIFGNRNSGREMAPGSGHFVQSDALPELSQEGIKAVLTEAYYTADGGFMVTLKLSNGLTVPQTVQAFDLTISNVDGNEIATGHQTSDWDPTSLSVPANGYADLTLYIPKEDVKLTGDALETLTLNCEITGQYTDDTPDTTDNTDATAK